ncbi:hypothetical protein WJX84_009516 [Apatococcus fuscideae]|uniref:Uncharacterized protein n=1 Tax=Apatococcus fuscideae TaxID=2026836 RepID=A0AAW1T6Y0_9CHLO
MLGRRDVSAWPKHTGGTMAAEEGHVQSLQAGHPGGLANGLVTHSHVVTDGHLQHSPSTPGPGTSGLQQAHGTGNEDTGQETMQEALGGALQGADGGSNNYVNLITGFYLENHRKNASEVTRMFVDAVTQKSRGGAKEAGFLPSHKSCPYHLHSLAEHIFPIDVLQGPKSFNDAMSKKFGRKKGDMGSSSSGVKDRGIFPGAEYRDPDNPVDKQEISRGLTPLLNILAATGRNAETVMQEVGQMRAGWLACDYRAWLKAYNPDFKRTKLSTASSNGGMMDAHPQMAGLQADYSGAAPSGHMNGPQHAGPVPFPHLHELLMPPPHIERRNDGQPGMDGGMAQQPGTQQIYQSGFPSAAPMGMEQGGMAASASEPNRAQGMETLQAAERRGSLAQPHLLEQLIQPEGITRLARPHEAMRPPISGPQVSSIGTLRLFLDSAFQQGLVTRTQLRELQAYVDECHTRRPAVVGVAAGPPNPLLNASFSAVRSSPGAVQHQASTQAAHGTVQGSLALLGGSSASRSSTLDGTAMQGARHVGNDPADTSAISQQIQNGNG